MVTLPVELYKNLGNKAIQSRDYSNALKFFDLGLRTYPDHSILQEGVSEIINNNSIDDSNLKNILSSVVDYSNSSSFLIRAKAELDSVTGDLEEALKAYQKIRNDKFDPNLEKRMAYCLFELGDHMSGISILEDVAKKVDTADEYLELGILLRSKGLYDDAENYFELAYEKDPNDINILSDFANIKQILGKPVETISLLENSFEQGIGIDNPELRYFQALSYFNLGEYTISQSIFESILNMKNLESHIMSDTCAKLATNILQDLNIGKSQLYRARELAKTSIDLDPTEDSFFALSEAESRLGFHESAIKNALTAYRLSGEDGCLDESLFADKFLADKYFSAGKYDDARRIYEKLSKLNPIFYLNLSEAQEGVGDIKASKSSVYKFRKIFPEDPSGILRMGEVLLHLGKEESSRIVYDHFFKMYPDHPFKKPIETFFYNLEEFMGEGAPEFDFTINQPKPKKTIH